MEDILLVMSSHPKVAKLSKRWDKNIVKKTNIWSMYMSSSHPEFLLVALIGVV